MYHNIAKYPTASLGAIHLKRDLE